MAEFINPINIEPYLKRELSGKGAPKQPYAKRIPLKKLMGNGWAGSERAVVELSSIISLGEKLHIAHVTTTAGNLTTLHQGITDVLIGVERGLVNRVELYRADNPKSTYNPSRGDRSSIEIFFQGDSGRKQVVVVNNVDSDDPYNTPA